MLAVRVSSCKPTSASANDLQHMNGVPEDAVEESCERIAERIVWDTDRSRGSLGSPGNLHRYCQFWFLTIDGTGNILRALRRLFPVGALPSESRFFLASKIDS